MESSQPLARVPETPSDLPLDTHSGGVLVDELTRLIGAVGRRFYAPTLANI